MRQRETALQSQIEAPQRKFARETENEQLLTQLRTRSRTQYQPRLATGLLQFESDQVRTRLAEIDEALRDARQLLDQARDRRGELSAAAAKLQSDAEYMAETCLNDLGIQRQELMADSTIPIMTGELLTVEDQIYREMRSPARCHGPRQHDGARRIQRNRRAAYVP